MVKRNAIATKLTKRCTQTQKRAFDVAVQSKETQMEGRVDDKRENMRLRTRENKTKLG